MRKFQIYGKVNMRIDELRRLPLLEDSICADDVTFEQGFVKFISRKNFGEHQCVYAISTDYAGLVTTSVGEPKNADWIAMSEAKPENGQYVLVCHDALDQGMAVAVFYRREEKSTDVFYSDGCRIPLTDVEWWMPLPPFPPEDHGKEQSR